MIKDLQRGTRQAQNALVLLVSVCVFVCVCVCVCSECVCVCVCVHVHLSASFCEVFECLFKTKKGGDLLDTCTNSPCMHAYACMIHPSCSVWDIVNVRSVLSLLSQHVVCTVQLTQLDRTIGFFGIANVTHMHAYAYM